MSDRSLKKTLQKIPVIGGGARIIYGIIKSPKYQTETRKNLESFTHRLDETAGHIANNGKDIRSLSIRIDQLSERFETMIQNQDTIQKQLTSLKKSGIQKSEPGDSKKSNAGAELFADNHLLDVFYTRFEDRFKDTAETKKLHKIYEERFTKSEVNFNKFPVLDVGCGRGEFLEYMRELKVNALGVDLNTDMVKRASEQGLKVVQGDAIAYLEEAKARSLGAITGFHLVEHIPFQALLELLSAAYSSLTPEGFALFETPNPENVPVATNSFYFDPSHLKPIPPGLLAFAFEVTGFKNVEIIRSYPVKTKNDAGLDAEIFDRFYGPRNYAVIGYK